MNMYHKKNEGYIRFVSHKNDSYDNDACARVCILAYRTRLQSEESFVSLSWRLLFVWCKWIQTGDGILTRSTKWNP
jgi:hypothetical protein